MHVLMSETSTIPGRKVADALRDAGHEVAACRGDCDDGLECAALRDGGGCPLEHLPIDVYVLVRSEPGHGRSEERGALCAAARRVPLVVSGEFGDNPYRPWTAAEQRGTDVIAVVEEVAARPLPRHSRTAVRAVEAVLGSSAESCSAVVHRRAGGLAVVVTAEPTPPPEVRAAAVTKVHQKLRELDPWARYVDVSFAS
jgi:hypothetical protein